jgi:hypothetical protein
MTDDEREAWIDRTPVHDVEAAVATLTAQLEADDELDRCLTETLAFRSGDPGEVFDRIIPLRET